MFRNNGNTEKEERYACICAKCLQCGTCSDASSPDWAGIVGEAERALDRQSSVLHPMHRITVKTLQQLLYAYIGKSLASSRYYM